MHTASALGISGVSACLLLGFAALVCLFGTPNWMFGFAAFVFAPYAFLFIVCQIASLVSADLAWWSLVTFLAASLILWSHLMFALTQYCHVDYHDHVQRLAFLAQVLKVAVLCAVAIATGIVVVSVGATHHPVALVCLIAIAVASMGIIVYHTLHLGIASHVSRSLVTAAAFVTLTLPFSLAQVGVVVAGLCVARDSCGLPADTIAPGAIAALFAVTATCALTVLHLPSPHTGLRRRTPSQGRHRRPTSSLRLYTADDIAAPKRRIAYRHTDVRRVVMPTSATGMIFAQPPVNDAWHINRILRPES